MLSTVVGIVHGRCGLITGVLLGIVGTGARMYAGARLADRLAA